MLISFRLPGALPEGGFNRISFQVVIFKKYIYNYTKSMYACCDASIDGKRFRIIWSFKLAGRSSDINRLWYADVTVGACGSSSPLNDSSWKNKQSPRFSENMQASVRSAGCQFIALFSTFSSETIIILEWCALSLLTEHDSALLLPLQLSVWLNFHSGGDEFGVRDVNL